MRSISLEDFGSEGTAFALEAWEHRKMNLRFVSPRNLAAAAAFFVLCGCGGGGDDRDPIVPPTEGVTATLTAAEGGTNANLTPLTDIGPQGDTDGSFKDQIMRGELEQTPGPDGLAGRRIQAMVDITDHDLGDDAPFNIVGVLQPGTATLRLSEIGADGNVRTWVATSGTAKLVSIIGNTVTVTVENAHLVQDAGGAQGSFRLSGSITFQVN